MFDNVELESEMCPYCLNVFYAVKGHDPLKNHFEDCNVLMETEEL
jgi:hypothetical protein